MTDIKVIAPRDFPATAAKLAAAMAPVKAARAEVKKKREAFEQADENLHVALGRMLRWARRVDELRTKRNRAQRELAKLLAAN